MLALESGRSDCLGLGSSFIRQLANCGSTRVERANPLKCPIAGLKLTVNVCQRLKI